jgi:peptide/nickel transport system ATP-binding protein
VPARRQCPHLPVLSPSRPLLEVRDLRVSYGKGMPSEGEAAVSSLSFDVRAGEIVGMQGRSGCGKTSTALAILNLLSAEASVSGSVLFEGHDLLRLSERELRRIRGKQISIIYQEPTLALNPVMRVGDQIAEVARAHGLRNVKGQVNAILHRVGLEPKRYCAAYPHELSGGERQRVVLSQALVCKPQLVIADEPTASLDASLKNEILSLIEGLRADFGTAFLLITHDRGIASKIADRVIEISAQHGISPASTLASVSDKSSSTRSLREQEPLITVRNLYKCYRTRGLFAFGRSEKQALDEVNFNIHRGTLTSLVGASGSGKSTLARCLALLEEADSGQVFFEGKNILTLTRGEARKMRPMLQYIPQDPAAALNPRLSAVEAVEEPLLIRGISDRKQCRRTVAELLERVRLDPVTADRSCHEFSGGQKHRLVIARALTLQPKLLIFDESLSGLDPETQAGILALLREIKDRLGITLLLISHDLELVSSVADEIAVMREGRLIDQLSGKGILDHFEGWGDDRKLESTPKRELVLVESE